MEKEKPIWQNPVDNLSLRKCCSCPGLDPYLQHTDNLHFVEKDEGGECGQEILLKDRRRGKDDVLDVLDPVGLVDLLS